MNTNYQPDRDDLARITKKKNHFKVSGDKVFATFQGEGLFESEGGTAGCPAVFLRLQFCNLHCGQKSGWKCDTGYTWDTSREEYWKEPENWTVNKTKSAIEKSWNEKFADINPKRKRVVITGGEPLLQQNLIIKLVKIMPEWTFEIETNGTILPNEDLISCQINCSPKLENSGNEKQLRYQPQVLKIINKWPVSWFKFVANREKDIDEIEEMATACQLKPEKILIMPEGLTKEVVAEHRKIIEKIISKKKWRIIERNQLIWFGPKRKT